MTDLSLKVEMYPVSSLCNRDTRIAGTRTFQARMPVQSDVDLRYQNLGEHSQNSDIFTSPSEMNTKPAYRAFESN